MSEEESFHLRAALKGALESNESFRSQINQLQEDKARLIEALESISKLHQPPPPEIRALGHDAMTVARKALEKYRGVKE